MYVSETKNISNDIVLLLHEKYNISHCVIQFETEICDFKHCDI